MKRPWAVILTALMLAGCRSSQPTTNPFMRTTVPPPGTGQNMMVMPSEPVPAGTVPPVVTTPIPATTAPAATPAPGPPAPLIGAPPPLGPEQPFHPPGGSYLYHQSSHEPQKTNAPSDGAQLASASSESLDPAAETETVRTAPPPSGVAQVAYLEDQAPRASRAVHEDSSLQFRPHAPDSRGDPPDSVTSVAVGRGGAANTIRIVAEPQVPETQATAATAGTSSNAPRSVLRMTVGESRPKANLPVTSRGLDGARVAFVGSPGSVSPAAANEPGHSGTTDAVQAVFQPVANSDYSHAADYRTLRGRLEYSHSLRRWKLRYIPIDGQTDAYGGSVVLTESPALASYQPGDMVAVRGKLAENVAASARFSADYELEAIEPVSR